jgi:hypothetical protein
VGVTDPDAAVLPAVTARDGHVHCTGALLDLVGLVAAWRSVGDEGGGCSRQLWTLTIRLKLLDVATNSGR